MINLSSKINSYTQNAGKRREMIYQTNNKNIEGTKYLSTQILIDKIEFLQIY